MKPDPMVVRKLKALQRIASAKRRGDRSGQAKAQNELNALSGVRMSASETRELERR